MEIKEEKVSDPIQEADEASGDARTEEYTSSGESTMTCSTLSSLISLPALESLSDSAPDLQQPDAKSNQCPVKRNRRGRRGRKPKQLPKTSRSDDNLLTEEEAMDNKDSGKRIKILLPQKVGSDMMNRNPNIANSENSNSENRLVDDVYETISALPNFIISKAKKKKGHRSKSDKKNVMKSADTSENAAEENYSDQLELDDKFRLVNKDLDSGLSDKGSSSVEHSIEAEIAFEKKVSELCKDIKKTTLGNKKREGNLSAIPSTPSKATSMDVRMPSNLNDITSGSAHDSDLMDIAGPSTSYGTFVTDSTSGQSLRGKIALAERRKKMFRNRRDTIVPKGFDATVKRKIMKLTDEIDQIDAILAKEIEKKDDYYQRGYKITHQILTNLKKEKEGQN